MSDGSGKTEGVAGGGLVYLEGKGHVTLETEGHLILMDARQQLLVWGANMLTHFRVQIPIFWEYEVLIIDNKFNFYVIYKNNICKYDTELSHIASL